MQSRIEPTLSAILREMISSVKSFFYSGQLRRPFNCAASDADSTTGEATDLKYVRVPSSVKRLKNWR